MWNRWRQEAGVEFVQLFGGLFTVCGAGRGAGVCSVDISPHALAAAERNFALNGDVPAVAACRHETEQADVFEWLREPAARRFDLIVLDRPRWPNGRRSGRRRCGLIRGCWPGLWSAWNRDGMLVAASCSAHVSAGDFLDLAREAARRTGRGYEEWLTTRHAPDHPATFAEGEYLKCIYLRFR